VSRKDSLFYLPRFLQEIALDQQTACRSFSPGPTWQVHHQLIPSNFILIADFSRLFCSMKK